GTLRDFHRDISRRRQVCLFQYTNMATTRPTSAAVTSPPYRSNRRSATLAALAHSAIVLLAAARCRPATGDSAPDVHVLRRSCSTILRARRNRQSALATALGALR